MCTGHHSVVHNAQNTKVNAVVNHWKMEMSIYKYNRQVADIAVRRLSSFSITKHKTEDWIHLVISILVDILEEDISVPLYVGFKITEVEGSKKCYSRNPKEQYY